MNLDEERQICERYYSRAIADATSDEEELAIALHLIEEARHGAVVNDTGTALVYLDLAQLENLPVDADFLIEDDQDLRQRLRANWPLLAAFLALFAFALVRSATGPREVVPTPTATAGVVDLPTMTLTPTATFAVTAAATATPHAATVTPSPAPTSPPTELPTVATPATPKEVEVKPEPVELEPGAVIPVSLEVAGRYFPVVPTTLRDDTWAYLPDPDRISWLAGSYVNVVLGLPFTAENLDMVTGSLALSDTLTVRTSVAGTNRYRVTGRTSVGVYEIEALSQRRAGLTLVLLGGPPGLLGGSDESPDGERDRRLVVWAVPAENQE
ncbi:MAG: hypothetical protein RBU35_20445 [Anaerolineae bacterium]|jgi:hypothetical protein|nr:hypothetical protein [Anaerolineae bacterium]